jgi:hypothetical protein
MAFELRDRSGHYSVLQKGCITLQWVLWFIVKAARSSFISHLVWL